MNPGDRHKAGVRLTLHGILTTAFLCNIILTLQMVEI